MHVLDLDRLTHMIYRGVCDDDAFARTLGALASTYACFSTAFVYSDQLLPAGTSRSHLAARILHDLGVAQTG